MPATTWSCDELTALLIGNVLDPQTKGTAAGAWMYCNAWGGPCPPQFWRTTFANAAQLNAGVALLTLSYANPEFFNGCEAVQPVLTVAGRVKLLEAIRAWGASGGFSVFSLLMVPLTYTTQALLLKIFADPAGSRTGSKATEVIAAAADVVRACTTPVFDAATWLPLWGWAIGGPDGGASLRTRSFAMKALEAILRRGTLSAAQIRSANTLATVLNNVVASGTAGVSAAERALYRSEATAVLGEVQAALSRLEMAALTVPAADTSSLPTPPPASSKPWPTWVPIAVGIGAVGLLLGGAILVNRRRQVAVAA